MGAELVPGVFWGVDLGRAVPALADLPPAHGCRVLRYGGDRVRLAAVVAASVREGELHAPTATEGFEVDPAWEGRLRAFCDGAGIPWHAPSWHLFGVMH
jgi:hypothetical protein